MIDVDGNLVDAKEVAAVTKITRDTSGYTSATVQFTIWLKGGGSILIWKRQSGLDSSSGQDEAVREMTPKLAAIRDALMAALPEDV